MDTKTDIKTGGSKIRVENMTVIEDGCKACRYEFESRCRRMPKQIDGGSWSFPPADAGCGEFKPRA